jgi:hypothetical protein
MVASISDSVASNILANPACGSHLRFIRSQGVHPQQLAKAGFKNHLHRSFGLANARAFPLALNGDLSAFTSRPSARASFSLIPMLAIWGIGLRNISSVTLGGDIENFIPQDNYFYHYR